MRICPEWPHRDQDLSPKIVIVYVVPHLKKCQGTETETYNEMSAQRQIDLHLKIQQFGEISFVVCANTSEVLTGEQWKYVA